MEGYRRMKSLRSIFPVFIIRLLMIMMITGCGNDVRKSMWVHENLASVIQFDTTTKNPNRVPLWRGSEINLTTEAVGFQMIRNKIGHGSLVMVSFIPGTEIGRYLNEAPSTWALYTNPATDTGYAMVYVQDTFTLDGLAALAHRETGCGALEKLSLVNTQAGSDSLTPPIFSEFIPLAPVTVAQGLVSAERIADHIKKLEAQGTRHHSTDTGLATSVLVEDMFKAAAVNLTGFTTEQFSHDEAGSSVTTAQKSVIGAIAGTTENDTIIVIGAHLDSINKSGVTQNAPGADDDASGIATLTEVLRVINASGWTFKRRVEFHGYAAEEVGLIGSSHIAQSYAAAGKKVSAMLQVDMNSWSQDSGSEKIHLIDQFTSNTLNRSLKDLLNTYQGGNYEVKGLKGGTSDHKSWYLSGYPAVFPFEDPENYNEALHSVADNSATVNNTGLSARFTKMILAFLAHHAGLNIDTGFTAGLESFRSNNSKDLYLAITSGSAEGYFAISVSAPEQVESVEFCTTGIAGSAGCIAEKEFSLRVENLGTRRVFTAAGELALNDNSRLAIFGYDTNDKINALRTVRLNSATQP